ncbi:hypothetical protein K6Q96_12160 [Grimontia kaedaensis]|uniref:Transposase n=1 Tax=Grimontia kaedaensis TaxID=2872157 RepID=A0ABY4WPX3_9GAMM|nr:hypothetical protein [Grimontia kaedaensis]USH01636.1 hypothetical protein K6Q96_12160 [Grimontia kaedaensis]
MFRLFRFLARAMQVERVRHDTKPNMAKRAVWEVLSVTEVRNPQKGVSLVRILYWEGIDRRIPCVYTAE